MTTIETKIYPSADIDSGEIRLYCETLGQKHATEVMYTKDKATRAALIALGWTPPDERVEPCKNGRTLILVTELYMDYDGRCTGRQTFRVDYDKFLLWKGDNSFEAGYIEHIIEAAINGSKFCSTSRKYSFDDCASWYLDIQTVEQENCFETVLTIDVEVG